MTEGGPTLVNHMAVKESGAARAPLIWASRSWPSESCTWDFGPPPPLKGRKAGGGSEMVFIVVDPGALIWTVGEVHPRSRTPPPPPCLKIGRQGGSEICYVRVDLGAQIWTTRSCLLLTTGASSPETLDKWVLTHSFDI
jgi:hypothetical protein